MGRVISNVAQLQLVEVKDRAKTEMGVRAMDSMSHTTNQ